jgi:NAD+ kinase
VRRVGFVLKRGSTEAEDILRDLGPRLRAESVEVVLPREQEALVPGSLGVAEDELGGRVDLLVVLGGDGTFLHGSALSAPHDVPLLGVNLGSLGFLAAFSREEAQEATLLALHGQLAVEERMRLEVVLRRQTGETEVRFALNDCVVSQGALARLLDLEALLDGTRITLYKADGLIIATPTGSTAYNLAAGGPILMPALQALVITPICPHMLTNRPLVTSGDAEVEVRVGTQSGSVVMTLDGQLGRALEPGDALVVRRAAKPLRVMAHPSRGFFDVLRQKLHWGERTAR